MTGGPKGQLTGGQKKIEHRVQTESVFKLKASCPIPSMQHSIHNGEVRVHSSLLHSPDTSMHSCMILLLL